MTTEKTYTVADLRFAADARCPCGAGLAYPLDMGIHGSWDCSAILTGSADVSAQHTAPLPFAFYEVKSEGQPSANGRTTRPIEDDAAKLAREIALLNDEFRRATAIIADCNKRIVKAEADKAEWKERQHRAAQRLGELSAVSDAGTETPDVTSTGSHSGSTSEDANG